MTDPSTVSTAFSANDQHEEFRSAVRAFLGQYSPEDQVRRVMETELGYDPALWQAMAEQLQLQGLAIPEEYGGEGFGFTELGIVVEETGAALLPGPFFGSAVLATNVLLNCADEAAKQRFLPELASGRTIAALALTEWPGRWNIETVQTRAERVAAGWRLHGTKHFVLDGAIADLLLVVARTDRGPALFAVDDTSVLQRRTQSSLDPTRRQAVITLAGAPATLVGGEEAIGAGLDLALCQSVTMLALEQVGGAQRCLDQAVGYVKVRRQFGRPIGSFQAIRHKCADLMLAIAGARGVAQYAAAAIDAFPESFGAAAALAKAHCSEVYLRAAASNIQMHGGIGFTWEHAAHLHFKRAQCSSMLFGDADFHRRRLADIIGLT
ncbi:acyl-CoA dehydrogenase family protein [Mycobacterium sp. UM_Kg1]|uniref:acyl-CoA dehydrogenase family protein n=1 Tax=Mycobacterium sp. UM_Kg1 TaxID=1545691 RepID=UPI00061B1AD5|nr:acyl-CoA dehydrogenase family protein [Mycobacterium sp. UM_Kg1]